MIFELLLLAIIILLTVNFRKGMILTAGLKLVVLPSVMVGMWKFNTLFVMIVFFFTIANWKKLFGDLKIFPLFWPFLLLIVSQLISQLVGVIHFRGVLGALFDSYFYSFVLFFCIKDKKDVQLLLLVLMIALAIELCNAVIEYFSNQGKNYLSQVMQKNSHGNVYFSGDIYRERGVRLRSGYSHSIVFGDICAIFSFLFAYLFLKVKANIIFVWYIVLFVIGAFLSNSRTPIIGILVFALPIFWGNKLFSMSGVIMLLLFFSGLIYFYDYFYVIFDQIFNTNSIYSVEGSSIDLRMEQLEGCFLIISSNIWFGQGQEFNLEQWEFILKGNESCWFEILCKQGIIGAFLYALLYIVAIYKSRKQPHFLYFFFLSLGWLAICTMSNLSNMDSYPFFLSYILMYKCGELLELRDSKSIRGEEY